MNFFLSLFIHILSGVLFICIYPFYLFKYGLNEFTLFWGYLFIYNVCFFPCFFFVRFINSPLFRFPFARSN